jgi:cyclic pyranopterin phosphate synthase
MAQLTHFDNDGNAVMVDVSTKLESHRKATACATVVMQPETMKLILDKGVKKRRCVIDCQASRDNGSKENP